MLFGFFFFKKGDFWNSQWNSLVFQHAMCMENVGNRARTHLSKYVSKMWNKRRITTVVTHMFFYSPKEPYQKIFRAYLRLFVKSRRFVFLHLLQVCWKKKRGHLKCHFITHDAKNGALKLVDEFSYYHCEMGSTWYWSFLMHDIYGQSVKMLNVKTYFVSKSQVSKYGPMPFFIEMTSACNVTSYDFFFNCLNP